MSTLTFRDQPDGASVLALCNDKPVLTLHRFEKNRHQQRGPVLIVASGPSAADFPLDHYRHIPMIAMNGSLLRLQQDDIPAFFYLCDDPRFAKARHDVLSNAITHAENVALNAPALEQFLSTAPALPWHATPWLLERVNRSWRAPRISDRRFAWSVRHDQELFSAFSIWRNKPNRLGFSTNMAKGYYSARTIPYCALQLACHLGFSHAYIVGLDLNPALGRCYPEGAQQLKSTLDIDYDDFILPSFQFMQSRLHQTQPPFHVYNLSLGSRLPGNVLPKLDTAALDALLKSPEPIA
jgi:Kdo-III transferase WaaZ